VQATARRRVLADADAAWCDCGSVVDWHHVETAARNNHHSRAPAKKLQAALPSIVAQHQAMAPVEQPVSVAARDNVPLVPEGALEEHAHATRPLPDAPQPTNIANGDALDAVQAARDDVGVFDGDNDVVVTGAAANAPPRPRRPWHIVSPARAQLLDAQARAEAAVAAAQAAAAEAAQWRAECAALAAERDKWRHAALDAAAASANIASSAQESPRWGDGDSTTPMPSGAELSALPLRLRKHVALATAARRAHSACLARLAAVQAAGDAAASRALAAEVAGMQLREALMATTTLLETERGVTAALRDDVEQLHAALEEVQAQLVDSEAENNARARAEALLMAREEKHGDDAVAKARRETLDALLRDLQDSLSQPAASEAATMAW